MTIAASFLKFFDRTFNEPPAKAHKIDFCYRTAVRQFLIGYMIVEHDIHQWRECQDYASALDPWIRKQLLHFLNEYRPTLNLCRRRQGHEGFEKMIFHFLAHKLLEQGYFLKELHLEESAHPPGH